jgi:hypothetical protein
MSDATSLAELNGQYAELLPARTVLSLLSAVDAGDRGTPGTPGTPGAPGESVPGSGSNIWFLSGHQQGGSAQGR